MQSAGDPPAVASSNTGNHGGPFRTVRSSKSSIPTANSISTIVDAAAAVVSRDGFSLSKTPLVTKDGIKTTQREKGDDTNGSNEKVEEVGSAEHKIAPSVDLHAAAMDDAAGTGMDCVAAAAAVVRPSETQPRHPAATAQHATAAAISCSPSRSPYFDHQHVWHCPAGPRTLPRSGREEGWRPEEDGRGGGGERGGPDPPYRYAGYNNPWFSHGHAAADPFTHPNTSSTCGVDDIGSFTGLYLEPSPSPGISAADLADLACPSRPTRDQPPTSTAIIAGTTAAVEGGQGHQTNHPQHHPNTPAVHPATTASRTTSSSLARPGAFPMGDRACVALLHRHGVVPLIDLLVDRFLDDGGGASAASAPSLLSSNPCVSSTSSSVSSSHPSREAILSMYQTLQALLRNSGGYGGGGGGGGGSSDESTAAAGGVWSRDVGTTTRREAGDGDWTREVGVATTVTFNCTSARTTPGSAVAVAAGKALPSPPPIDIDTYHMPAATQTAPPPTTAEAAVNAHEMKPPSHSAEAQTDSAPTVLCVDAEAGTEATTVCDAATQQTPTPPAMADASSSTRCEEVHRLPQEQEQQHAMTTEITGMSDPNMPSRVTASKFNPLPPNELPLRTVATLFDAPVATAETQTDAQEMMPFSPFEGDDIIGGDGDDGSDDSSSLSDSVANASVSSMQATMQLLSQANYLNTSTSATATVTATAGRGDEPPSLVGFVGSVVGITIDPMHDQQYTGSNRRIQKKKGSMGRRVCGSGGASFNEGGEEGEEVEEEEEDGLYAPIPRVKSHTCIRHANSSIASRSHRSTTDGDEGGGEEEPRTMDDNVDENEDEHDATGGTEAAGVSFAGRPPPRPHHPPQPPPSSSHHSGHHHHRPMRKQSQRYRYYHRRQSIIDQDGPTPAAANPTTTSDDVITSGQSPAATSTSTPPVGSAPMSLNTSQTTTAATGEHNLVLTLAVLELRRTLMNTTSTASNKKEDTRKKEHDTRVEEDEEDSGSNHRLLLETIVQALEKASAQAAAAHNDVEAAMALLPRKARMTAEFLLTEPGALLFYAGSLGAAVHAARHQNQPSPPSQSSLSPQSSQQAALEAVEERLLFLAAITSPQLPEGAALRAGVRCCVPLHDLLLGQLFPVGGNTSTTKTATTASTTDKKAPTTVPITGSAVPLIIRQTFSYALVHGGSAVAVATDADAAHYAALLARERNMLCAFVARRTAVMAVVGAHARPSSTITTPMAPAAAAAVAAAVIRQPSILSPTPPPALQAVSTTVTTLVPRPPQQPQPQEPKRETAPPVSLAVHPPPPEVASGPASALAPSEAIIRDEPTDGDGDGEAKDAEKGEGKTLSADKKKTVVSPSRRSSSSRHRRRRSSTGLRAPTSPLTVDNAIDDGSSHLSPHLQPASWDEHTRSDQPPSSVSLAASGTESSSSISIGTENDEL